MLMESGMRIVFSMGLLCLIVLVGALQFAEATPYGRGRYGTCTYNSGGCTISLATSGTVDLTLQPTVSGVYTIDKDEVEVTTNSNDGFTLSLESASPTENALVGSSGSIAASSGTPASPMALALNNWGFRVDNLSGFGVGPTSAVQNQSSSSLTFAGVPLEGSSVTVRSYDDSAPSGVSTDVWYGVGADLTLPADTYTQVVTYTAVAL